MEHHHPGGETRVAVLIDEGMLLLFGWLDRSLPQHGSVLLDGTASAIGDYDGLSWPKPGTDHPGAHGFVAVLRFANIAQVALQQIVLVPAEAGGNEEGGEGRARYTLPAPTDLRIDAGTLLATLRAEAPAAAGPVFDFLCRILNPETSTERRSRFLLDVLGAMAEPSGFAEIFGRIRDAGLLFQGWSFHLLPASTEMIVETTGGRVHAAMVAAFDRPDLPPTARGIIVLLAGSEGIDLPALRRFFYRQEGTWYRLDIFENRTLLPEAATVPHLRDMLPKLRAEGQILRSLKRIVHSRYEGHETVTKLDIPVRAALDTAIQVPGAGIFVSGWMLDPLDNVTGVTLRGRGGTAVRISEGWCRTARPDVSNAFGREPLFAGRLASGDDAHGFVAFSPIERGEAEDGFYLELALADDSFAFMPVTVTAAPSRGTIRQLLSSFSLNDPAVEAIVARHVGPIVQAASRHGPGVGRHASVFDYGRATAPPRFSVILPIETARDDIDVNLARFAVDPDFQTVELVIVAPRSAGDIIAPAIARSAGFYGLRIRLVLAVEPLDRFEALDLGTRHATAETVVFLSPSVFPTRRHWLTELERGYHRMDRLGMISPTLLYEDYSIKFAGIRQGAGTSGRASTLKSQFAGYARHWLDSTEIMPVDAGTTDCCLLPKRVFAAVGGFSKDYVGADYKGLDLSLKIRAAGMTCLWTPAVEMIAVDDGPRDAAPPDYWLQTGGLVDAWGFDRKWSQFLAKPSHDALPGAE